MSSDPNLFTPFGGSRVISNYHVGGEYEPKVTEFIGDDGCRYVMTVATTGSGFSVSVVYSGAYKSEQCDQEARLNLMYSLEALFKKAVGALSA